MAAALRFQRKHENLYNVFSAHLCSTFIVKPVVCVYAQMTAVRRVLCIETVSAAVHLPVHLRKNAWEPTCIVWMAATVLMVFKEPPQIFLMSLKLLTDLRSLHAGLILQNGTCIAASQCPCVYHGTSYVQGQVLQQGCSVWWVWKTVTVWEYSTANVLLTVSVLFFQCVHGWCVELHWE